MRFGCCLPGWKDAAGRPDFALLLRRLERLHEVGFDFAEFSVQDLMALAEEEWASCAETARTAGLPVRAANSFIPARLPVVGPEVDSGALRAYVDQALARAQGLGIDRVVFGSGGARRCPDGYPPVAARGQIVEFLRMCHELARPRGVVIVIEPLNATETNTILSVEEGAEVAVLVDRQNVRLLADTYHMYRGQEGYDVLPRVARFLSHVHIANREERRYPGFGVGDADDLRSLFAGLREAGYEDGVSIECRFQDFDREAAEAIALMRSVHESV